MMFPPENLNVVLSGFFGVRGKVIRLPIEALQYGERPKVLNAVVKTNPGCVVRDVDDDGRLAAESRVLHSIPDAERLGGVGDDPVGAEVRLSDPIGPRDEAAFPAVVANPIHEEPHMHFVAHAHFFEIHAHDSPVVSG
jgi:hypothetical protein